MKSESDSEGRILPTSLDRGLSTARSRLSRFLSGRRYRNCCLDRLRGVFVLLVESLPREQDPNGHGAGLLKTDGVSRSGK